MVIICKGGQDLYRTLNSVDIWCGGSPLRERYNIVFSNSLQQERVVYVWVNDEWCWEFRWRRPWFEQETFLMDVDWKY